MLAISCLRQRWGQKNRQLGQQTTHVEDCGLGHRTGVRFPATPRFKSRQKWRLFLYSQRFRPLSYFTTIHCKSLQLPEGRGQNVGTESLLVAARHKEYDMDEARSENEALSLMEKYSQEEDF